MRVITDKQVFVDHLIWEPVSGCSSNCSGCYLTNSKADLIYTKNKRICTHLLGLEADIKFNQLTISFNNILGRKIPESVRADLRFVGNYRPQSREWTLCGTCADDIQLGYWAKELGISYRQFADNLEVVSFTRPSSEKLFYFYPYKINRQVIVNRSPEYLEYLNTDQIYLLLKKSPLGQEQNTDDLTRWFISYLHSDRHGKTLIPDLCVVESLLNWRDGVSCGAGINRAQLWGDNTITACPYDTNRIVDEELNRVTDIDLSQEIRTKLHPAQYIFQHPINQCGIPVAISRIYKRDPSLVKEVLKKLAI